MFMEVALASGTSRGCFWYLKLSEIIFYFFQLFLKISRFSPTFLLTFPPRSTITQSDIQKPRSSMTSMRSSIFFLVLICSTFSFSFLLPKGILKKRQYQSTSLRLSLRLYAEEEDPLPMASSSFGSVFSKLGIEEVELAKGVDADEVLEWLGTKEDFKAKMMKDNKKFSDERAEVETAKFLLDAEMVNRYIAFRKKEADPDFQRVSREENFSDPKTVALYAAWLIGGVGLAYFKNVIAAPKYASGEWEDIKITLPDWLPGQGSSGDAAASAAAAVSSIADSLHHLS